MGLFRQLFSRRSQRPADGPSVDGLEAREILALAHRCIGSDELEQALQILGQGVKLHPGASELSLLRQRLEQEVARARLDRALEQLEHDRSAELRAHIARLFQQIDEPQQALEFGTIAIQADPQLSLGYQVVGSVHLDSFRDSGDTIAGMNALRYVVKAHSLAQRDSRNLLHLAEIFTILRAPTAARRFLDPVRQAFPENALGRELAGRLADMAPEETSQIQELFLRYERMVLGAPVEVASAVELPPERLEEIVDSVRNQPHTSGFYLVDAERRLLGGFHVDGWSTAELGNAFGVLAETAHQNCARMDLGTFGALAVQLPGGFLAMVRLDEGLTGIYFGAAGARQAEVLDLLEGLRRQIATAGTVGTA